MAVGNEGAPVTLSSLARLALALPLAALVGVGACSEGDDGNDDGDGVAGTTGQAGAPATDHGGSGGSGLAGEAGLAGEPSAGGRGETAGAGGVDTDRNV